MSIKPFRLEPGMTVGIIAPASAPGSAQTVENGIKVLEEHGYKVKLGKYALEKNGFFAGTDRQRLADIHSMFRNPKIHAIICLRGGYGTPRLLKDIDYKLIKEHPKIFVGFSDITGLHIAFSQMTGLVTFHGPMLASNIANEKGRKYSIGSLLRILSKPEPFGSILKGSGIRRGRTIRKGRATRALIGGNLSLLVTHLGTPWDFSTKGKIVFIEDIGETNYRIDRMLTHLLNAGKLADAAGIVFGYFTDCEEKPSADGRPTQKIEEILCERTGRLGIPVAYGFPFGHESLTATLPYGIKATFDATKSDLIIEESAVK